MFKLHTNTTAMKNYKLGLFAAFALIFSLESCIEHEIIPAPVPMVDLSCNFLGNINGSVLELTQNVNGYTGKSTKNLNILPAPSLSSAAYNFEMSSASSMRSIKIVLGSVQWDATAANSPDLPIFNSFHNSNTTPSYSSTGSAGFEVSYKDANGVTWTSKQNSPNPQNVTFTGILQESDTLGDYSKFTCNFNCYVYNQNAQTLLWDSIYIENGILKGWFQR